MDTHDTDRAPEPGDVEIWTRKRSAQSVLTEPEAEAVVVRLRERFPSAADRGVEFFTRRSEDPDDARVFARGPRDAVLALGDELPADLGFDDLEKWLSDEAEDSYRTIEGPLAVVDLLDLLGAVAQLEADHRLSSRDRPDPAVDAERSAAFAYLGGALECLLRGAPGCSVDETAVKLKTWTYAAPHADG